MLLRDLNKRLIDQMLEFLWRQWSQLGVAGTIDHKDHWVIDPETLLLFSLNIARYDARLFDEIYDWVLANERWISLQRLKGLVKYNYNQDTDITLTAIARSLVENKSHVRWKRLANKSALKPINNQPFFRSDKHGEQLIAQNFDEHFMSVGWLRSPLQPRMLSRSVSLTMPTHLIMRLRALFGLSPRVEILAYLITHERSGIRDLTYASGYSRPAVHEALNSLIAGGFIINKRNQSNRAYELEHKKWTSFLSIPDPMPKWISWMGLFAAIEQLVAFLTDEQTSTLSEYLIKSKLLSFTEQLYDSLIASELQYTGQSRLTIDNITSELPHFIDCLILLLNPR